MSAPRKPPSPNLRAAPWLVSVLAPALSPLLASLFVLAAWQAAAQAGWLSGRLLPAPSTVAAAAVALARSGELWSHAGASLLRVLAGLVLGGGAALILGAMNATARRAGKQADALLQALGLVPVLAFAPLILLWLGVGEAARLALLSLGAFFPIYRQTVRGIRAVDPGLIATGRSHGLHGWALFLHVILPGALPSILTGLRQGLGLAWLILVALEVFAAPTGVGLLAEHGRIAARADLLLLGIALYAAMSAASQALVHLLARHLLRWSPAHRPELFSRID